MSPRRPVATSYRAAVPTLVALLAAGVAVEGCIAEASAQTPPAQDAGVRTPPPPPPIPTIPPHGLPHPAGAPMMVHPTPGPRTPSR